MRQLVHQPARRDYRRVVSVSLLLAILALGYLFSHLPGRAVVAEAAAPPFAGLTPTAAPTAKPRTEAVPDGDESPHRAAIEEALQIIAKQIDNGLSDEALAALETIRPIVRGNARAYLLVGRALEAKKDFAAARDFYAAALDRDAYLSDAYWGVATTSEAMADLEAAVGAMRSYLHTEPDKDPERLRIAQARSALWEWEARLGRGPWGPTKGIPPGFTADDLRRDGRGVAIRMPVPGTEQSDGSLLAEIKHADKKTIFPRP